MFSRKKRKPQGSTKHKPMSALQVGVTSACNLRCTFCPTTFSHEEKKHMTLDTFRLMEPYFPRFTWVYLQGWGEPLLNDAIWDMAEQVKKAEVKTGFTTNATLFSSTIIKQILQSCIDLVSISIAGDTADTHNAIRKGSDLHRIKDAVKELIQQKQAAHSAGPRIQLSYMLTKETIEHLPETILLAHSLGVDDLYAIHLDYVFSPAADAAKIFSWNDTPDPAYQKIVDEAVQLAAKLKLSFRHYPLSLKGQEPVCELNPNQYVFITTEGEVTPCTYLGRKKNPRIFKNTILDLPQKTFGNLHEATFETIWQGKEYNEFRMPFVRRQAAYQELVYTLTNYEPDLLLLQKAENRYEQALMDNPFPSECQSCPKAYGI